MSDEQKARLKEHFLGKKKSEVTRKKMSEYAKTRDHTKSMHSPEARKKAAESNKGKVPWHAGTHLSEEHRENISLSNKGRVKTIEERIKIGKSHSGDRCHFWKGGIGPLHNRERVLAMCKLPYKIWRQQVFERDNYTCLLKDDTCSGPIQADHIKSWANYPDLRYNINNGRTLCKSHHERTPNFAGRIKNELALEKQNI